MSGRMGRKKPEPTSEERAQALLDLFARRMGNLGHAVVVTEGPSATIADVRGKLMVDGTELRFAVDPDTDPRTLRLFAGNIRRDVRVTKTGPIDRDTVLRTVDDQQTHLAEEAKHDAMAKEAERLQEKFGIELGRYEAIRGGVVIGSSSRHAHDTPHVFVQFPKLTGTAEQIEAVLVAVEKAGLMPKRAG